MTRSTQLLAAAIFALACAGAGYALYDWRSGGEGAAGASAGEVIFAATLPGLDGQPEALAQWRGKVLIVNFWATWCAPCREEIPAFIKLQEAYGARGAQFIGIAVDQKERAAPYARDIGINYPVLIGGVGAMELAKQAGDTAAVLPFTLILSRDGKTHSKTVGIVPPEKLQTIIERLL